MKEFVARLCAMKATPRTNSGYSEPFHSFVG
jgi:hypothetical protein